MKRRKEIKVGDLVYEKFNGFHGLVIRIDQEGIGHKRKFYTIMGNKRKSKGVVRNLITLISPAESKNGKKISV